MGWAGHVECMRAGERPRGRPKFRREDNIKMHVREIGHEIVYWIKVSQNSFSDWPF